MKYRYRVSFTGKVILQVTDIYEDLKDVYPTSREYWRDATATDIIRHPLPEAPKGGEA